MMLIKEFLERFDNGYYKLESSSSFDECYHRQLDVWFDWFCKDDLLVGKTNKLGKILRKVNSLYCVEEMEVVFKNNCPCEGKLYDDIRLSFPERPCTRYVIIPKSRFDEDKLCPVQLYDTPLHKNVVESKTINDVYKYFKELGSIRNE